MSNKTLLWYKANGLMRHAFVRNFGILKNQLVVNEYPKCGATWLSQLIESSTGIDYPRLMLPGFNANILHGHYLNAIGIKNGIVMWRDPRDVLVSHFFHCVHYKSLTSDSNTRKVRMSLGLNDNDVVDFERDFPKYFRLLDSKAIHPYFTVQDFYSNWFKKDGFVHTSYERLQRDTKNELSRVIYEATNCTPSQAAIEKSISRYDFEKISGRSKGSEVSKQYLRKGIVGDWVNYIAGSNLKLVEDAISYEIDLFSNSELA